MNFKMNILRVTEYKLREIVKFFGQKKYRVQAADECVMPST